MEGHRRQICLAGTGADGPLELCQQQPELSYSEAAPAGCQWLITAPGCQAGSSSQHSPGEHTNPDKPGAGLGASLQRGAPPRCWCWLRAGNSALAENKTHRSYLSAAGSACVTRVKDEISQVNNSNTKPKLGQFRRIQEEK